jgi:hypothetical protein
MTGTSGLHMARPRFQENPEFQSKFEDLLTGLGVRVEAGQSRQVVPPPQRPRPARKTNK